MKKAMSNLDAFVICVVIQCLYVHSASLLRKSEKEWPDIEKPHFKYTMDQLLTANFPKRTSDDIFLDPCKSGKEIFFFAQ